MKKIAFASGKGGAGKTSLSMSFHKYAKDNSLFADCDVDAADAFLLLEKEIQHKKPFYSGLKYKIDENKCIQCGKCADSCNFNAIKKTDKYYIEEFSCEGCSLCEDICKYNAIESRSNCCGELFISDTVFNTKMIYARLIPGEDNSGKLVHEVKKIAHEQVLSAEKEFLVIDCPPGIGCPLMAAISGINLLVIIIECSQSGFKDAVRLINLSKKMKIPYITVINKSGLNPDIDNNIEKYLADNEIFSAGKIPFDKEFVYLLNRKKLIIDSDILSGNLKNIFSQIKNRIEMEK
ncbi:MAG: 4Fe-4S binding protein [Spirochaetes bacterium]|nr:4Fe-4S binding protein [Spirochaetota bacterium]